MAKPRVVILGAGPAGVGAAFRLTQEERAEVTVLERNSIVGGNAGSFQLAGLHVDYGSHRLHPACNELVLRDIRHMLGGDLLERPRHGRIRLRGHWIHFPLKPLNLALKLPPSFTFGVIRDIVRKVLHRSSENGNEETFSSVLEKGLGKTICREFYFPYARKLWGLEPDELAVTQARRRISAGSLTKMISKVLAAVPGFRPPMSGRFFYPRDGYGQICEAYYRHAKESGTKFHFNATVRSVEFDTVPAKVRYEKDGQSHSVVADQIWSTIPITVLAACLRPALPAECFQAAESIDYRAMILIYLVLEQNQFTDYDAHYFPETQILISRLSEPKNYSASKEPRNRTVLCAELPCSPDDTAWRMSDEQLGKLMCDALATAGIPVRAPILEVMSRRLRQAYPIYRQGFDYYFNLLDQELTKIDGLLSFGRQGLFAHDNTHHALFMAYAAVDCLAADGSFDPIRWGKYRHIFETHVVED